MPFFLIPYRFKEVILTLRIRLRRMGKKKSPFYRIVVADSREAVDGKFKEILGYYDPFRKMPMKLDLERVDWWVAKGAKPTESVLRLMSLTRRGAHEKDLELEADTVETLAVEAETVEPTEEDS